MCCVIIFLPILNQILWWIEVKHCAIIYISPTNFIVQTLSWDDYLLRFPPKEIRRGIIKEIQKLCWINEYTNRLHCAYIIAIWCVYTRTTHICTPYLQDFYGLLLPNCNLACSVTYTTNICSNRVHKQS